MLQHSLHLLHSNLLCFLLEDLAEPAIAGAVCLCDCLCVTPPIATGWQVLGKACHSVCREALGGGWIILTPGKEG